MRVGFIGLGATGSRMAANLQKSGCQLAARHGHGQEDFSAIYAFLNTRRG